MSVYEYDSLTKEKKLIAGRNHNSLIKTTTMPTASADLLDKHRLYVGETTEYFTKGGIYECQLVPDSSPAEYTWVCISVGKNTTKGNAVVIGDSYFDNPNVYNFAEYLTSLDIYDKVSDYAENGSGFGITSSGTQTLYQKLQNAQMRADIEEADVIYMHLGGNDVMSTMAYYTGTKESDIVVKINTALNEIYTLNPNVTIYYIPSTTKDLILSRFSIYAINDEPYPPLNYSITKVDIVKMLCTQQWIELMLAASDLSIYVLDTESTGLITDVGPDYVHPTARGAAAMFDRIINGNYTGIKISWLEDKTLSMYAIAPSVTEEYMMGVLQKLFLMDRARLAGYKVYWIIYDETTGIFFSCGKTLQMGKNVWGYVDYEVVNNDAEAYLMTVAFTFVPGLVAPVMSFTAKPLHTLEYLTAQDIDDLMEDVAESQWSYLADVIVDNAVSLTKVWSSNKVTAMLTTTLDSAKTYTDEQIAKFKTASYVMAASTSEMSDPSVLYLLPVSGAAYYDIYALIDGVPTAIGTTQIQLTDYYTKTEADGLFLKKADGVAKTRYESEVGDITDLDSDFTATDVIGAVNELLTKSDTFESSNIDFGNDW